LRHWLRESRCHLVGKQDSVLTTFAAALACAFGFQLVDWSDRIPASYTVVNFVITVEPFYTRLTIYPLEQPDERLPCCGNKPTSFITLPRGDGKFCIRQSQPNMKWKMRVVPTKERMARKSG
jgi:hypothetical protein